MKKSEKKYGLLKWICLLIFVALILTWLVPTGAFAETGYTANDALTRVGINDIAWLFYYGLYFSIDKIMMLFVIAGLYGVLSKIDAYDRLTSSIAKKLSGNKKITVVFFSVLIAALTSVLTQSFVVLIYVPFIISILNKMKLDKLTIMSTTFGSMLIGIMGATYGSEGLVYLLKYLEVGINNNILVRLGILGIGLLLFNFFMLMHMNNTEKDAASATMFPIQVEEKESKKKKSSAIPIIIILVLLFAISILGYIDWNTNFKIEIFNKFHESLTKVKIGKDFYIFTNLLGSNMGALGTWDLFSISAIVFLATILLALCYRIKFTELIERFESGLKRMFKPMLCIFGAFMLMVVVYMSPYLPTIINKILTMTDSFNLVTMTLSTFILNIFHTDLGFTGYNVATFFKAEYSNYIGAILVILTSIYGFVQFFIPTSILMGIGITSLDIKYKEWLKYIWKFLVGMLICLLVIFILITVL